MVTKMFNKINTNIYKKENTLSHGEGRRFESGLAHNPFRRKSVNVKIRVTQRDIDYRLGQLRAKDRTRKHIAETNGFLIDYLNYCGRYVTCSNTQDYLQSLKQHYSNVSINKRYWQIVKLLRNVDAPFISKIEAPEKPRYNPQRVTQEDIAQLLKEHENDLQMVALINLGIDTGARPLEIYQTRIGDYNLEAQTLEIKKDQYHTVKNDSSCRVVFYTTRTTTILREYFDWFNNQGKYEMLFSQKTINRKMKSKNSKLKIKMLRHWFASQCFKLEIPNGAIHRYLGHSLNDPLDRNYMYVDVDTLQQIYNRHFSEGNNVR